MFSDKINSHHISCVPEGHHLLYICAEGFADPLGHRGLYRCVAATRVGRMKSYVDSSKFILALQLGTLSITGLLQAIHSMFTVRMFCEFATLHMHTAFMVLRPCTMLQS